MPKLTQLNPFNAPKLPYIGRFAPSPSGPLHIGSLIAALASYLDAKSNHGLWYVRMEDLDPPRESPEAAQQILSTLEHLNLFWDGTVLYQSQRHQAYDEALDFLQQAKLSFPCTCSRQQISSAAGMHQGVCKPETNLPFALRCNIQNATSPITFRDLLQGQQSQNITQECGDFVIKRKDGFYAYQLAVVVDDAFQEISHIIRGIDLLSSTGRQIYLQSQLGFSTPKYGHIPVIVNDQAQKLSKQHFAQAVTLEEPQQLLLNALKYLQQAPEPQLAQANIEDILNWAIEHWNPHKLDNLHQLQEVGASIKPKV